MSSGVAGGHRKGALRRRSGGSAVSGGRSRDSRAANCWSSSAEEPAGEEGEVDCGQAMDGERRKWTGEAKGSK